MPNFWFKEFDMRPQLPDGWQKKIIDISKEESVDKILISSSITSREISQETQIPVMTVSGRIIKEKLPWLYDLYAGKFRDIAQNLSKEEVFIANDDRYAININIQRGCLSRYECHVDSNPIEGLLYVTNHPIGSGGELVISMDANALGVEAISNNAIRIYPSEGKLVFFDARDHPHFVAPLTDQRAERIVVAMNYYTPSCPESSRPADLNRHLGIE